MAGTACLVAKKLLVDAIQVLANTPGTALAAIAGTRDAVQVAYAWPGEDAQRELVHGGRAFSDQDTPVSGGGRPRISRDENVTVVLHVVVTIPGGTPYDSDLRATEVGEEIENWLAGNPNLGQSGVVSNRQITVARVTAVELDDPDVDDDGAISHLAYEVGCKVRLT